ncbi:hypothetical protein EJ04DRAFT_454396, partial [Polyplosphaeria fusca]
MTITHIVLFQWKPTTHYSEVKEACERMLALRDTCVHPATQKRYIISSRGGRNNSVEGRQGAFTHGFVMEFENEQDRRYYIYNDPSHLAFVASVSEIMQNSKILDFEPG